MLIIQHEIALNPATLVQQPLLFANTTNKQTDYWIKTEANNAL